MITPNMHLHCHLKQSLLDYGPIHNFWLFSFERHNGKTEKTFKNEQRSKDAAAKKRPTTSGVGKINNYYDDIYIPPYNNTDSPHLYIVTIPIDSTH